MINGNLITTVIVISEYNLIGHFKHDFIKYFNLSNDVILEGAYLFVMIVIYYVPRVLFYNLDLQYRFIVLHVVVILLNFNYEIIVV